MSKLMNEIIEISLELNGDTVICDVDMQLIEDGITYNVYQCSVSHRDLLFYSDKGTLNYLIDSYGDNHTIELFEIGE